MSKVLFIFDPGHGGILNGEYATPGKRSPHPVGDSVLYEGVNNRDNVNRMLSACKSAGLDAVDIVSSNEDISLAVRVDRANKQAAKRKTLYISVHSDAAPGGDKDWVNGAKGITVYTSPGQTESDRYAEILISKFESNMSSMTTIRKDTTDGDKDKEAKFYVLTETNGPAVLIEGGFHTNQTEAILMVSETWKNAFVKSVMEANKEWEDMQ